MSRDDPQVRLRHMLAYAREAVELMRNRRRADLDIDRALGLAILRCVKVEARTTLLEMEGEKIPFSRLKSKVSVEAV